MADLLGDHPQLLKVDEALHLAVIAQVDERKVFLRHWEERDLKAGYGSIQWVCKSDHCLLFELNITTRRQFL